MKKEGPCGQAFDAEDTSSQVRAAAAAVKGFADAIAVRFLTSQGKMSKRVDGN